MNVRPDKLYGSVDWATILCIRVCGSKSFVVTGICDLQEISGMRLKCNTKWKYLKLNVYFEDM